MSNFKKASLMKTFNLRNIVHVLGKFDPLTNSDLIHDQLSCFFYLIIQLLYFLLKLAMFNYYENVKAVLVG